jgi:hypothetical protein
MNSWIDLHALWQILVVGLIAGAGLPALFAVGLRALSLGGGDRRPGTGRPGTSGAGPDRLLGGSPVGIAAAGLCFAVVLAGIGWGIYYIVAGS